MRTLILFFIFLGNNCLAQKESWYWPFGDSAAIQFTQSGPVFSNSSITSLETSSSYCDSGGNVLVYIGCGAQTNNLKIFNRYHNIMLNGDSINGGATITQGSLLLPFPNSNDSLLSFSITDIAFLPNFYWKVFYSIISLSGDSGKGSVISLNNLLQGNYTELTEKMISIRHANGRDWWLLLHGSGFPTNKDYIKYLITPYGINGPFTQNIPNSNYHFSGDIVGQMAVSQQGDKIAFAGEGGTLDILDFDRCSGTLTLRDSLGFVTQSMQRGYYGCSFSASGNMFYASSAAGWGNDTLFQWDLTTGTKTFIWVSPDSVSIGQYLLGPDGKIYIACAFGKNNSTTLDSANQYLSVINMPDNFGQACNFVPYQTWLGGQRSWIGLPNIPNYSLGRMDGSACDSLTGLEDHIIEIKNFTIQPNPNNGDFSISYLLPQGHSGWFEVYDILGKQVFKLAIPARSTLQNIQLPPMSSGMYNAVIMSGYDRVSKKIAVIKE